MKIMSYVFRRVSSLRPEKKCSSRLSGGCAIIIMTGKKSSSPLSGGCAIVITTGKKEVLVVCLAGARSLLLPEKKFQLSVWQVRDCYYDRKKKRYSCLSGGCALVITSGKKKFQSSVWRVRDRYYDRKKKFQSSVWRVHDCYYDRKKSSSRDFYSKLNVSNLNVTNLYQFYLKLI